MVNNGSELKNGIRYYHGTSALATLCISVDGFRVMNYHLRNWYGGALGSGIYVTTSVETAIFFAGERFVPDGTLPHNYILRVIMSPGTRILRLDGVYDSGVIKYLSKEFGKAFLTPRFDRAIPSNKHLTRVELIHLANYLWHVGEDGHAGGISPWAVLDLGPMRKHLIKHKYDGMGCTVSGIGVVVFNPSRLVFDAGYYISENAPSNDYDVSLNHMDAIDAQTLAAEAAQSILDAIAGIPEKREDIAKERAAGDLKFAKYLVEGLAATLEEIPRWRGCLRAYCKNNLIAVTENISAALQVSVP